MLRNRPSVFGFDDDSFITFGPLQPDERLVAVDFLFSTDRSVSSEPHSFRLAAFFRKPAVDGSEFASGSELSSNAGGGLFPTVFLGELSSVVFFRVELNLDYEEASRFFQVQILEDAANLSGFVNFVTTRPPYPRNFGASAS